MEDILKMLVVVVPRKLLYKKKKEKQTNDCNIITVFYLLYNTVQFLLKDLRVWGSSEITFQSKRVHLSP